MHYYTVESLVKKLLLEIKREITLELRHHIYLKPVIKSQENKKATYQSLCKCNDTILWNDIKWNVSLELGIDETIWKNIYMACFYTIKDNTYKRVP